MLNSYWNRNRRELKRN